MFFGSDTPAWSNLGVIISGKISVPGILPVGLRHGIISEVAYYSDSLLVGLGKST